MTLSGVSLKFGGKGRKAQTEDTEQDEPAAEATEVAEAAEAAPDAAPAAAAVTRKPWIIGTATGGAAVIAIGLIVAATHGSPGNLAIAPAAAKVTQKHSSTRARHKPAVETIKVMSVSPSSGSAGVNGASPITVTYSRKLPSTAKLPTLSPSIAGSWQVSGDTATFSPSTGYTAGTHVSVHIPANGTAKASTVSFTTGQYSTTRLEQLLAQLGYLPVTWTPSDSTGDVSATDANAQLSAAYDPPSGSFSFHSGYPTSLTSQWSVGSDNIVVQGAVRTFEYDQGLTMDGLAGPSVWAHLFKAVATDKRNEHGYTYVYVSQSGTEHMTLYHDGRVALTTEVNTGIAGRGTDDGTFPVYERFQDTIMSGTNPDGSKYHDNVQWVSYFNGSDAVHYFPRYGYGYYQSLGCVEVPYSPAVKAYNLMTYGTLVTVAGPEA